MELAERMAMTKVGQVTWADPRLEKKCTDCKHAVQVYKVQYLTHICELVKVVSGKKGKPYDAKRAVACSKFESVDIPTGGS